MKVKNILKEGKGFLEKKMQRYSVFKSFSSFNEVKNMNFAMKQGEKKNYSDSLMQENIPKEGSSISSLINELISTENVKKRGELYTSQIRLLSIGKNYFRHVSPRRKKILMCLLNSYFKQFKDQEGQNEVNIVLDLYYNNEYKGKKFDSLEEVSKELTDSTLWHLNTVMILDRIASQYSRFEFMEYDQIINSLNSLPQEKRNKAKYVFTNQPNQPNSTNQLYCLSEVMKAIEENDLDYMDLAMILFRQQNLVREFTRPTMLEELITYYSNCIPDLISCFSNMYELGLKDLSDFFEIPETSIILEDPKKKNSKFSLITYVHGLNLTLTVNQYINLIEEADLKLEMTEILENLKIVKVYADKLMQISDSYRKGELNKNEFFLAIPVTNILGIESHIKKCLREMSIDENRRVSETSKKMLALISVFRLVGVYTQIKLRGEELKSADPNNLDSVSEKIHDELKEFSILSANVPFSDMITFDYDNINQYNVLQNLLKKYQIIKMEVAPLIKSSNLTNDTNSTITQISLSKTRQKEGIILTELTFFKEYKKNPNKWIYMGQGNTAERGGGPYGLTHQKYNSLTRVQRQRHIRTVQGYFFTSEFSSKDLIFTFLVNGAHHLTIGDHFEPTTEYIDFLYELDSVVGAPQREMQKKKEFNDLYVDNEIVKTLVESFDYAGSEDRPIILDNVKSQNAIVQSYIFSDRCSFTHPELAFWDLLDENLIKKIAKNYYDNNRHFKYILYNYAFMLKRSDLEFAISEVGLNSSNPVFEAYMKGRNALDKILTNIGLGTNSTAVTQIYNQHLGLVASSNSEETNQKFQAFRMIYKLQNDNVRELIKHRKIGNKEKEEMYLKNVRILQSTLANVSSYNGKG